MNSTMQCLTCGTTRGTMQKLKHPERQLRCAGCEQVTRHRAMADPVQGDWREDQNLSRTPQPAQTVDPPDDAVPTEQPVIPEHVQAILSLAGVVPVFVAGLNREAWLESVAKVDGRPLLLINADVGGERLADIAGQALAVMQKRGE